MVEAETAFVRPDCTVELYTITTVYMNFAVVVYPGNTEADLTFWFGQTTQKVGCFVFRVLVHNTFDGFENFFYCLQKILVHWHYVF